ncbi:MAG: serine/threonine-protein phosphatase [Thermoplasmata archaeon]|nr:serine/threonine-protein phosphatase [Thermoplasmata archaeon]
MDIGLFGDRFWVTAATVAGRRGENQDSMFWLAVSGGVVRRNGPSGPADPAPDPRGDLFVSVVCDGMGGLPDGAAASDLAVKALEGWALSDPMEDIDSAIQSFADAVSEAERRLIEEHPGSGTTVSAMLAVDDQWASVHLGDSRCYVLWEDHMWRSRDHSPVESMFREGLISEEEMNDHPLANIVSRYMGGGFFGSISVTRVPPGWDRLALCTDGAFGYMPPSDFEELLRGCGSARDLAESALERGSTDNVTAVTVLRSSERRSGPSRVR